MKYHHIRIEEREKIQEMLWENQSIRAIAQEIGRSPSSISRELKKNISLKERRVTWKYLPRLAHQKALKKRSCRGRKKRLKNDRIRTYVVKKLKLRWSPEQIAGRMSVDIGEHISHEAIYQYIYYQVHRNGYGYVKLGKVDLRQYLRRRRKRRIHKGLRNTHKIQRFSGCSIENRPKIVDRRTRIGDWETDTVESRKGNAGVNTLLERKSGLFFITKLYGQDSGATTTAIVQRLQYLPVHTITFDNGSENAGWRNIEAQLNTHTYFCHPYCSGERGSDENTNGLLRDYCPKGTDFAKVPEEELAMVEYMLNTRPRKRLGWKTPLEVFNQNLRSVALRS